MGLWLKQADGLVSVSNGGGAYDGEHVLSGNPLDPPAALQVGQLLYDGNPSTGGSGAGIEEAPVDGLPYARKDEGWVEVGDISSLDGEHVPTGDPTDPATLDLVDEGQLLYDGIEGGESGDAGPHSHTEYAPAEHDHDYLPLAGGTLTGDLTVDGMTTTTGLDAKANGSASPTNPNITFGTSGVNAQTGFYRNSTGAIQVACEAEPVARFGLEKLHLYNDLLVDGTISGKLGPVPADFWRPYDSGTVFTGGGMGSGTQGSFGTAMTCNGYRNVSDEWTSLGLNNSVGATSIELLPTGTFYVRVASDFPTGSASTPPVVFSVTDSLTKVVGDLEVTGTVTGTLAFGVADSIDTRDVLERAEVATMPVLDDEGVATTDVDSITVNEVVTALLAKVKELSARIEELEGN
jgi:hypothetical protein